MGSSVIGYLLLTLIIAVNARYSTFHPDNSNDQETSQADPATCRSCGSESAIGGTGATTVHRMVRSTTRLQLRELDDVSRPLRLSLDRRTQRLEEKLAVPAVQPTTTEDGAATFKEQMSMQGGANVMLKLLAILQRFVDKYQSETPDVQPSATEPSSETRVTFSISDSPTTTSTTPPPPGDRGRTTEDVATEEVATEDVATEDVVTENVATEGLVTEDVATEETERERQRVELRIEEAKARMEKSRRDPSLMGEYLCIASFYGHKLVRPLLDNGTDVNYMCTSGYSPLTLAVSFPRRRGGCKSDVVSLLLERGADVNAIDVVGLSALHNAAFVDSSGFCAYLLLGKGADVDARNKDGVTPLHIAASRDAILVVRALLAAGARRNLRGWSGRWKGITPFDVAKSDGVLDLLRP